VTTVTGRATALLLLLAGLASGDAQPLPLEPGKPVRLQVTTPGGKAVILRVEVEGGGTVDPPAEDALTRDLRVLYRQDQDVQKVRHAQALAGLYRWCADAVAGQTHATAGDLRKALGAKSTSLLPADVLVPVRMRVRDELRTVLPGKANAKLDADTRKKAAALFARLAGVMESLSGGR
jgi:hypothetical protein